MDRNDSYSFPIHDSIVGGVIGSQYRETALNDDNVTNNTVILKGTAGYVYGGFSWNGAASKNKVTISGGTIALYVMGGWSAEYTADENTVEISYGTINNSVYGGKSDKATAAKNTVTISGGTIEYSVYGGQGYTGVTGNTVEISGGTINGDVNGGSADYANPDAPAASVTGNSVKIFKTATTTPTIKKEVYGGYSLKGAANNNTVEISGGTIGTGDTDNVYGGRGKTSASENKVTISGGTLTGQVYSGYSVSGVANNNNVEISDGTINSTVNGGYVDSADATATGNTVTISGGTINGDVNGGFASITTGNTIATGNTVNILTQLAIKGLYGGIGTTSSGNTLNLAAKGVTATAFGYFQNLNFYLPTDMTKSDTMLTVNGTANVDGATVGVLAQGTLTKLKNGDTITLLKADTLSGTISNSNNLNGTIATAIIPTSITTVDTYTFGIKQDNNANAITATLGGISTSGGGDNNSSDDNNNSPAGGNNNSSDDNNNTPGGGNNNSSDDNNNSPAGGDNNADSVTAELQANTKSMVETRAASTTILNAGADMLAGQGFQQAANAIAQAAESGDGQGTAGSMTPFAAIGTGSLRAESGSYVDAKSWAINVGFAREITNRQGKLLFGPLVEYGRGSYDSYLDNGTHGEGNSSYLGLGLMARQTNHDGLYYEGSLRGGKVKADYSGNVNTLNVNYDSSSNYIAAHLGLGKISKISADDQLDCYVKYFYSRQSGDNVTMHAAGVPDEVYNFDSVSSHRLRLGTRLTHKLNKQSSLYGGVAYQYEFDGDARATYNGNSTPSPSVKGGSGMFELGWQVKPDASPLTLDLGLTAWAGKQRGLTGQLGMNWKF